MNSPEVKDVETKGPAANSPDPGEGVLGQVAGYPSTYSPALLHSILRQQVRDNAGLGSEAGSAVAGVAGAARVAGVAEVKGEDCWTGYEFSWLNTQGKPWVAAVRLRVPCQSDAFVESKSLKLYLNSYAQTKFATSAAVLQALKRDLSEAFRSPIRVELIDLAQLNVARQSLGGICLDDLDIFVKTYQRDPQLLRLETNETVVSEALYTDLFRSLCPVTGQPDWASVAVEYTGAAINREGLLQYLISYRAHQAFHETTIEQIFSDISSRCNPRLLSVYGCFQRRGGLDINPFRSNHVDSAPLVRLPRQ